ncbi:DUF6087 family protein [Streptomyces sp. NPDC002537]
MGKHARRTSADEPSDDPLAVYHERRRPPADGPRRHRPVNGGGRHVRPDEQRLLEEWDGFGYQAVGVARNLAEAQAWAREVSSP